MIEIPIEWSDTEKPINEDKFKAEKEDIIKDMVKNKQNNQQNNTDSGEQIKTNTIEDEYSNGLLSDIISDMWNDIAVTKGYEAVSDEEKIFLTKHAQRFEAERINKIMNPTTEFVITELYVYGKKYLKKRLSDRKNK